MPCVWSYSRLSLSHATYPSTVVFLSRLCAGPVVVACRRKYNLRFKSLVSGHRSSRHSRSCSYLILSKTWKIARPLSVNDTAQFKAGERQVQERRWRQGKDRDSNWNAEQRHSFKDMVLTVRHGVTSVQNADNHWLNRTKLVQWLSSRTRGRRCQVGPLKRC